MIRSKIEVTNHQVPSFSLTLTYSSQEKEEDETKNDALNTEKPCDNQGIRRN